MKTDTGAVVRQISPGERHEHAFSIVDGRAVDGDEFVVQRPTRGMWREIRRRQAILMSLPGVDPFLVSTVDGKYLDAEAHLGVLLTKAPAAWWRTPKGADKPALFIDDLFEHEIDVVWAEVQRYLKVFEPAAAAAAAPAGAKDAAA